MTPGSSRGPTTQPPAHSSRRIHSTRQGRVQSRSAPFRLKGRFGKRANSLRVRPRRLPRPFRTASQKTEIATATSVKKSVYLPPHITRGTPKTKQRRNARNISSKNKVCIAGLEGAVAHHAGKNVIPASTCSCVCASVFTLSSCHFISLSLPPTLGRVLTGGSAPQTRVGWGK